MHQDKAQLIFDALEDPYGLVGCWAARGALAEHLGRFEDASHFARQALSLAEKLEDPVGVLEALETLSAVAVADSIQDWQTGATLFERIITTRRDLYIDRPVFDAQIGLLWCQHNLQQNVRPKLAPLAKRLQIGTQFIQVNEPARPFTYMIRLLRNLDEQQMADDIYHAGHAWLTQQANMLPTASQHSFLHEVSANRYLN